MWKYLIWILIVPCCASAQSLKTFYAETVQDNAGKYLEGVSITNMRSHYSLLTNEFGFFEISAAIGDSIIVVYPNNTKRIVVVSAWQLRLAANIQQQYVTPILSPDYMSAINNAASAQNRFINDTFNNIQSSKLRIQKNTTNYLTIKNVQIKENELIVSPYIKKHLMLSGSYSTSFETKQVNKTPALQNEFVQGRPQNGALIWQGPETNEMFSFGPSINTLQFDGSAYPYDANGKLAPRSPENKNLIAGYNNSILRNTFSISQSLSLHGNITNGGYTPLLDFSVKLMQNSQSTIIQQNENKGKSIYTSVAKSIKRLTLTGSYNYVQDKFSNSNRNGFLNRVYQNALLTPISFNNNQVYNLSIGQKAYSKFADNPYFLLNNNGNSSLRSQNNGGLVAVIKGQNINLKLTQSMESVKLQSNEVYKPSTAFFETGCITQRSQQDIHYFLKADGSYKFPIENRAIELTTLANYNFNSDVTVIDYFTSKYRYQRATHGASVGAVGEYSNRNFGFYL